ncbi:hypothetical protein QTP70_015255, partial [Hemibagrus guttatus]
VHGEELTQPASMTVQPGQSLSIHCKPLPPALPEGPQGVPRSAERHQSLSSVSCVFPGASSRGDMPGTPLQGDVLEASETDARATSTAPFDVEEQRLYSKLLTLSLRERPATLRRKLFLAACTRGSYPFGHDPELMAIGESRSID